MPTLLLLENTNIDTFRVLEAKNIFKFLSVVITMILLIAIIMLSFNIHKYLFYISLILVFFMLLHFTRCVNNVALPIILLLLFIGVIFFMLKHEELIRTIPTLVATIELQTIGLFVFAHFLVIHKRDFIKRDQLKQVLIDDGYINMFINFRATKFIVNANSGEIIDANLAASRYYGYTLEELKEMNIGEICISGKEGVKNIEKEMKSDTISIETRHRLKNGDIRWVEVYPSDFTVNEKKLKHIIVHDINDKKEAEIELNLEKNRFKALLGMVSNYTYSVVFNKGTLCHIIYDENCYNVTGYTASELNSDVNLWSKIVYPDDLYILYEQHKIMQKGISPKAVEYRIINKQGELVWIKNSPLVKYDSVNNLYIFEGVITDITKQKTLELNNYKNIIMAQDYEREYFSQELHDGIGPLISVAKLYTDLLSKSDNKSDEASIINLQSLLEEVSQSVRDLSNKLNPAILDKQGVVEALKQFISKVNQTNAIKINLDSENWKLLDDFIKKNIYRIITELINNTLKYANANEVNIFLKNENDIIEVEYSDDGKGFDIEEVQKKSKGMGLSSIKNRLSALNGDMKIVSEKNRGVQIKITINTRIKI